MAESTHRGALGLRLALEGAVIVLSILLAFGVDAWWDAHQERAAVDRKLASLTVEMTSNRATLADQLETGEGVLATTRHLIGMFGPNPNVVPVDSLARLLSRTFSFGAQELEVATLSSLLGGGTSDSATEANLQRHLLEFRAAATSYQDNEVVWFDLRERVLDRLAVISPSAFIMGNRPNQIHGPTAFPVPVKEILQDPELQARLSNLAIRTWNLNEDKKELIAVGDSILDTVAGGDS